MALGLAAGYATDTLPRRDRAFKNVILILLDDVGFGATSTFGGPVATPAMDELAKGGLRSPRRAALLSGRNDPEIGFGTVIEAAQDCPGYNSIWPGSAASTADILKLNCYSPATFGESHSKPRA
jgi:arylsulfatase